MAPGRHGPGGVSVARAWPPCWLIAGADQRSHHLARRDRADPLASIQPRVQSRGQGLKELREPLANQIHHSLQALEETLTAALRFNWEHPQALLQLTAYPW